MNLQENIHRIKEVMGIEKQPINEYFFSGLLDKIADLFGSGLDSERQQIRAVESFQKLVDFMTKITMKDSPVKGLERMVVKEIGKQNWGANFNNPKDKGTHVEFKVKIEPLFDDPKGFQSADEFHEFNNFVYAFFENAKRMGLTYSSPLDDKDVITSRVTYTVQSEPHKYHRVS